MNNQVRKGVDGPLKGIKVLDWTMFQFGPVATAMLGDMGADVIKIEALNGDVGRAITTMTSVPLSLDHGRNAYFEACNRNKRGVAVDLTTESGKKIAYRLVEQADIFIENFRKGVPEKLGMDYETLRRINPRLIYGSGSGYGPEGPDSGKPALDGCGQARGGLMMAATRPWHEEPNIIRGSVSDQMAAVILCLGVVAALQARTQLGVGQKVDVSHLSSTMWLLGLLVNMGSMLGVDLVDSIAGRDVAPVNPMVHTYQCKDDRWIYFYCLQFDRHWKNFATGLGLEELIEDPRLETIRSMTAGSPEISAIITERFKTRTSDEWIEIFNQYEDMVFAKVQTPWELANDPQVIANNYITDVNHPVLGKIKMCDFPVKFSKTPAGVWKEAPELGQDTEMILIDELGYDWDDIKKLQETGSIR